MSDHKAVYINSTPLTQEALAKIERTAIFLGISKSQAACFLIKQAPTAVEDIQGAPRVTIPDQ